jgi:AcrR family transcriptional regulator
MAKRAPRPDTEELKRRVRAAAVRLFARSGFPGTSVQAIADEVGLSKQALLYHFPSKERLREAALQEMLTAWRDLLPGLLGAFTGQQGGFDEALAGVLARFRAEPAYARFLMQELLLPSADRHPLLRDVGSWLGLAADFIRGAQRDGKVDPAVDPEAFMINFGTFLIATLALLDQRPERGKPSPDRVIKEMARMLGASLRGKGS